MKILLKLTSETFILHWDGYAFKELGLFFFKIGFWDLAD